MKKAVFKYKYYGTGYDKNFMYMVYEYRGYEYTVYENRAKGNEPLAWQHKSEQDLIDKKINAKEKNYIGEPAEIGLNLFFESFEI